MRIEELGVDKILVSTVAKVASASFYYSLKDAGFKISHGHSLRVLRDVLSTESNCMIISGIRNPLARNLSYFFQTYSDRNLNDVQTSKNYYKGEMCYVMPQEQILECSTLRIIDLFFSQKWHFTFNDWLREFLELTGIDDFDMQRGAMTYKLERNNWILFYRYESLRSISPFIEAFFGIDSLPNSNNSAKRIYSEKYSAVKKIIAYPDEYKKRLLSTEIMNIFYSRKEIKDFWDT